MSAAATAASGPIGVVTGLKAEAAAVPQHAGLLVACHGPGPARAASAAADLVARNARALLSFGVAAGLDPSLRPGTIVVATAVVTATGRFETDTAWAERMRTAAAGIAPVRGGIIYGSETILAGPSAKRSLHERYNAVAADMESHAVAAAAAGLPFLAVRVVLDAADQAIPAAAAAGMAPDGGTRPGAVIAALLQRPQDLPALIALGRANAKAMRVLAALAATIA
ncbi:MAG: hypothetical protein AB7F67_07900 [Rhodospirillaceae bacterium]